MVAILDVWLVIPPEASGYSIVLSWVAIAAMPLRRHAPFLAVLITVPGFFVGWSQLAAMIALGTLAYRHQWTWRTKVGALLVGVCRYVLWPWEDFLAQSWREHLLAVIYAVTVVSMPVAIGMLITIRAQLSERVRELAASRERERELHAENVRSAERARLAREMHDVVSHQVTLIAMQAGALRVSTSDPQTRQTAESIRQLSTKTLEELRELVGVLRSSDEDCQPGLESISTLVRVSDVPIQVRMEAAPQQVPTEVSQAAFRTIQEALTNVRKHAGGVGASVLVRRTGDTLLVEVRNDRPIRIPIDLPSGGHGLLGLRERAGLLGGTFHAGPTPEGGFEVAANYPIRAVQRDASESALLP